MRHHVLVPWACLCLFLLAPAGCGDSSESKSKQNNGTQTNNAQNNGSACGSTVCGADERCDEASGTCTCRPGFTREGDACVEVIVECESDDTCDANASCVDGRCRCDGGWEGDGASCQDFDECADSPCPEHASCTNTEGSFACLCDEGFTGDGTECVDVDECAEGASCANERAECVNEPGGWSCACEPGYTGDGQTCSKLVDCVADPDACSENASCEQTEDGAACVCDPGFSGDGITCTESGFATITAGYSKTCGLRRSGRMACWGAGVPGAPLFPVASAMAARPLEEPTGTQWIDVHVRATVCGVREDTSAACWNGRQWSPLPETDWQLVRTSLLGIHGVVCGIKTDGSLWCWGSRGSLGSADVSESDVPVEVDEPGPWKTVELSYDSACAIKTDGSLWCWGRHGFGQSSSDDQVPTRAGTASDWTDLTLLPRGGCGVRTDGSLWCWGIVGAHELTQIGTDMDWAGVETGGVAVCARKTDDSLWCWGANLWGERGDLDYAMFHTEPQKLDGTWSDFTTGDGFTCALDPAGNAFCWGHNMVGQLGNGETAFEFAPARVSGAGWIEVALGQAHTCATRDDSSLWCWGSNLGGQAGLSILHEQVPVRIAGPGFDQVSAGIQHTCGARNDGTLWCMGFNGGGQLGLGENVYPMMPGPRPVGAETDWLTTSAAGTFTCGLRGAGELWCWGTNAGYQLGLGDQDWRYVPTKVGSDTWKAVDVARADAYPDKGQTCAIRDDDTLWCWGTFFKLPEEGYAFEEVQVTTPELFDDGSWQSIDLSIGAGCGIRADGTLWCWGINHGGKLGGDAGALLITDPTQIGTGTDWQSVSSGVTHTCGIKNNGTLWCWGDNSGGQLGVGDAIVGTDAAGNPRHMSFEPVQIGTATNWASVAAGDYTTCATRDDTSLWCWGNGRDGQTGLGKSWTDVPQRVLD